MLRIHSAFDSGNIAVLDESDPSGVRLRIRPDHDSTHFQWFHFRVAGGRGRDLVLHLTNAGGASYPEGWPGYRAVCSYDSERWFRVPTGYDAEAGVLTIRHRPERDPVWYAYFAPYPYARHQRFLASCTAVPGVLLRGLGSTLDGRPMDLLQVGRPEPGRKVIWAIARQHPGETMGSFWMEGFLGRLLDPADAVARELRERAVIYVVPHMNPDGGVRGHLRTNACGANLNRCWAEPTAARSPEVLFVRDAMDAVEPQLVLDVHGDEAIPHNFVAGGEGVPRWSGRQQAAQDRFKAALLAASPDFQLEAGYPVPGPGEADLRWCAKQVSERYGAVGLTLEMPFHDALERPDPVAGWSPERSAELGRACLQAVVAVLPQLR